MNTDMSEMNGFYTGEETISPRRTAFRYLAASAGVAAAAYIYEYFSHGVYSPWMMFAHMVPLVMGFVPYLIMYALEDKRGVKGLFSGPAGRFYRWGIACFTAGCLMKGVLEIYGTTNAMTGLYWAAGTAFICVAAVAAGIRASGSAQ